MTVVTKTTARSFFETGDKPTQAQFEALIDSAVFGNGTATGVVEIESTNSSTILARGAFGRVMLSVAATASALNQLGITSVGTVGNQLLSAIATASAQQALGAGTVGIQLIGAVATASAQNAIALGTANDATFNRLIVSDGSAAAPAITFSGDTNMGFYRIGADNMGVAAAGSRVLDISAAGEIIAPLQPAFLAYNSADDVNQTGAGTDATVDFDTEVFDQGGDFATDTFTAPVTGRYRLSATVTCQNFGASANQGILKLVTSNRTFHDILNILPTTNVLNSQSISVLADMDAADTATVAMSVSGMAGDTVTIDGATPHTTTFSGELVA